VHSPRAAAAPLFNVMTHFGLLGVFMLE